MVAATHRRRPGTARVLGTAMVAAATLCGVAALVAVRASEERTGELAGTTASIDVPPSTIAPIAITNDTASARTELPGPVPPAPSAPTTTAAPVSPLSSLVGEAVSVVPAPPGVDVAPVALTVSDIGVDAVPIRAVGLEPDGQLEIPDATEAGWYRLGAAPGQPGATVIAAHVSWRGRTGPFLRLGEVEPGAFVDVTLADGTARRYQVVERAQHGKLALPADVWRTDGPEALVLITCGGAFDERIRRYADNVVVTAVPVA